MSKPPYFAPWSLPTDVEKSFRNGDRVGVIDSEEFEFAELSPSFDEWSYGEVLRARLFVAAPELLEALRALVNRFSFGGMTPCLFDALNPCWNNRPTDKPGLHWGATDDNQVKACDLCIARAAIAKAEGTAPGRAEQSSSPSQPKEAKS